jgi:hypothetical protein
METVGLQSAEPTAAGDAPARRKLRVGLFADSLQQPAPIVEAFARIAASQFAQIVVIAVDDSQGSPPPGLWRAYGLADRLLFGTDDRRLDLSAALPQARTLRLRQCDVSWLSQGEALCLDVAFALGAFDDYALERLARFGCWRYFFGEERGNLDGWAGFREVAGAHAVSASGVKLRCAGVERIAYRSWSRTYPFSASRNRDMLLRKTAGFAERALLALHAGEDGWLQALPPAPRQAVAPQPPSAMDIARGLASLGGRMARRAAQKLALVDQWCLAYRFDAPAKWHADLGGFHFLMPPRDRFWADPFPMERDGRHFIFFEELLFATGKGHISVMEVRRDGSHTEPVKVLERGYHLSYPFLIEESGDLFMVPETGQNRTVEMYRCVNFPDRWQLEKVLLEDAWCVDATFHRHADKWWMFVNIGIEGTEIHDELHLYSADRLLGSWQAHPGNPVKSDARNARPAGRLYSIDGELYRPAQICAPLYGSGIVFNRVTELGMERYAEGEAQRVLPGPASGLLGIHTYNRAGGLTVIDGFRRTPRFPWEGRARAARGILAALLGRVAGATRAGAPTP